VRFAFVVVAFSFALSACTPGRKISLHEVQDLGGIRIDSMWALQKRLTIYLHCNVAGIESVTVKPVRLESTMGIAAVQTRIEGRTVFLTIRVGPGKSAACPVVEMRSPGPGKGVVAYRDPDGTQHLIRPYDIGVE
jgi:hypothetical protein